MFALRPELGAVLSASSSAVSDVSLDWLASPPPGYETLRRSIRLPASADVVRIAAALDDWRLHRQSGLRVVADGTARPGTTVALAARLGPSWAIAPCRVVHAHERPDRAGFTYVTLPGHPEHGIEEFLVVRDSTGARFEIRAVSRPSLAVSRMFPLPHRAVQRALVRRYLQAALDIGDSGP